MSASSALISATSALSQRSCTYMRPSNSVDRLALGEIGADSWSACRRPGCRRRRRGCARPACPAAPVRARSLPARYFSVKARGSAERGNEQIIFVTMPASIIAAMPIRPLPALLLMTVRFFGLPVARKRSISAWISSIGAPEPPKPPIINVMPSSMPATAVPSATIVLFIRYSRCGTARATFWAVAPPAYRPLNILNSESIFLGRTIACPCRPSSRFDRRVSGSRCAIKLANRQTLLQLLQ